VTRIVDDNANNWHVRPSPDGTRIAFSSDRDGEQGVYVADANGGNVRRVSPPGYASVPSWSPDSRSLAFVRADPERPKVWNLWTLELERGNLRQVTHHRVGAPWGGSWFPDGRRIAYSHETRLVIHDLATGHERVFPSPQKGKLVRTPAVSPDGRQIIFQVHRDGTWLLDLADGSMRKVLEDATAQEYAWSRDGSRVAYHSAKAGGWGVWVMAPR
jgi:Tol biopolymer transport system component